VVLFFKNLLAQLASAEPKSSDYGGPKLDWRDDLFVILLVLTLLAATAISLVALVALTFFG
jgi:hypothetical protein